MGTNLRFDSSFLTRIAKPQHAMLKKLAYKEEMQMSELMRRIIDKEIIRLKKKHGVE